MLVAREDYFAQQIVVSVDQVTIPPRLGREAGVSQGAGRLVRLINEALLLEFVTQLRG